MSENIYKVDKNDSDDEVVEKAGYVENAHTEMMRRLKDSIEKLNESNRKSSRVMEAFTVILIVIGFFQLVISFLPDKWKIIVGTVYAVMIIWALYKMERNKII